LSKTLKPNDDDYVIPDYRYQYFEVYKYSLPTNANECKCTYNAECRDEYKM